VKQQRILPTLSLIVGVGGLGALAYGIGPGNSPLPGLWQALLAPHAARADDGPLPTLAPARRALPVPNPFATLDAETLQPTQDQAPRTARAPASVTLPAAKHTDRYHSVPNLEPLPQRRTNPQLAETGAACTTKCAGDGQCAAHGEPELAAERPSLQSKMRDRYASFRDEGIIPVTHNEPVAEDDEPAPAAIPEEQDSNEPIPAEPIAEPIVERAPAAAPETFTPTDASDRTNGGVTLQWITPTSVSVGQEVLCQLVVRNVSDSTAQAVQVEAQVPVGVDLGTTEPRAATDDGRIVWELGDMAPGATTTAQVSFTPREQGDVTPRAALRFTRQVAATIQIVEARLTMTIEGPQESVVGQPTPYQFRVTNEGTGPAIGVAVDVALGEGLEAASGSKPRYVIGTLSPGESRHVQVMIFGAQQGDFKIAGQVVAGKRAMDKVLHNIRIVQPALAVAMEGPKLRFVDRRAAYTIKVQNPGPAAIDNVQLLENIPEGFRFVEATSGGSFDRGARQVAWFVGRLEANEAATVGVQLIAVEEGDHRLNAAAKADFGVIGEAETTTRVKGAPHVVIDVTEDDDPVEVDGETIYRIRLSNAGSTPARRVQFAAEVPREMQVLDVNGPVPGTIKGRQLVFPPVAVLEPGQNASYDVHVKCQKAGQVRFKAYFRSEDSPDAVLEEETTKIYAD
jgi:uncharacterized repeat protein (TIGR01451 family)